MRTFLSGICASALAVSFALTGAMPVNAAPVYTPQSLTFQAQSDVVQVRHRKGWRTSGNYAYYNGHRGYRHRRSGYRQYNGFWFPLAAFAAGAVIGGTVYNSQPRYYRSSGNAHVRWCYDRYRSYRAWDNTFQPYHGPRQQCYSPYD